MWTATALAEDDRVGLAKLGAPVGRVFPMLLQGIAAAGDETAARASALKCAARAETLTEVLTGAVLAVLTLAAR